MKKVKFLMKQYGEYVYTPRDIYAVYTGQDYDVNEDAGCIRGYDSWQHAPKKMWAVEEIEIPEWMTPEEYIAREHAWKWYTKIGGTEDMGKQAFEKLTRITNGALRLACVKLLKTKTFRSEFRKSLKNQLLNWIEKGEYALPFSWKQEKALVNSYVKIEAKQLGVA
jgi:hypothetical protein